jgi:dihydroorotase
MPLNKLDGLELPATADFHVHLRDGKMMELVTPTIKKGANEMANNVHHSLQKGQVE